MKVFKLIAGMICVAMLCFSVVVSAALELPNGVTPVKISQDQEQIYIPIELDGEKNTAVTGGTKITGSDNVPKSVYWFDNGTYGKPIRFYVDCDETQKYKLSFECATTYPGKTISVYLNGSEAYTLQKSGVTAGESHDWTTAVTLTSFEFSGMLTLEKGVNEIMLTCWNFLADGSFGANSQTGLASITLDLADRKPVINSFSTAADHIKCNEQFGITVNATDDFGISQVEYKLNNGDYVAMTDGADNTYSANVISTVGGDNNIRIKVTDTSGLITEKDFVIFCYDYDITASNISKATTGATTTYTGTLNFRNTSDYEKPVIAILAVYNNADLMMGFNISSYTVASGNTEPMTVSVNVENAANCKAELMVWDSVFDMTEYLKDVVIN